MGARGGEERVSMERVVVSTCVCVKERERERERERRKEERKRGRVGAMVGGGVASSSKQTNNKQTITHTHTHTHHTSCMYLITFELDLQFSPWHETQQAFDALQHSLDNPCVRAVTKFFHGSFGRG